MFWQCSAWPGHCGARGGGFHASEDILSAAGGTSVSHTKHIWYSEHGTYCQFEIILERAMSVTHVAIIPCTRTSPDEEEFLKK